VLTKSISQIRIADQPRRLVDIDIELHGQDDKINRRAQQSRVSKERIQRYDDENAYLLRVCPLK
jgi:hypothetical protein